MFPNNGPVAAQTAVRAYIATVGLGAIPEVARERFTAINNMSFFAILTEGVESIYAALRELDLPNEPLALQALGEAAQAAAQSQLESKTERWLAIQTWAAHEISPVVPAPPVPEVLEAFTFIVPAPGPEA